jgi:hypothetical protein
MLMMVSVIILMGCVQLLSVTRNPAVAAGTFAATKLIFAFLLGHGVVGVMIVAAVTGALAFGYFWLLNRVQGSWLWWPVLAGGIVLVA